MVASLGKHLVQWDKRHVVVDQLGRASESIMLNLVEGARLHRSEVFRNGGEFCRQSSGLPRFVRGKGGAGD